ncbi:siphovirus ReqiPepy6 Gp37-like family protein [Aureibacillus halotolerans]|uniref:ReqiPepy6 Gp37-like protein n=1 Tax=Aureibacillus halotolerans TaxID=1508390 RepID=A0A4R6U859_9BACI|nr:siphovirus ReqiPepy6 Gp37-like family protein [Aureibacillus halotolerans]TDQ39244.1 ReqiPepy6 Gp37-like protein [Aureibacillus halotolerans]
MSTIRVIDRAFNFLGDVEVYSSLIWRRSWHGIGSFELHCATGEAGVEHLVEGNLIYIVGNSAEAAEIDYVQMHDSNGGSIVVRGTALDGWLSRRITYPPNNQAYDTFTLPAESAMKRLVQTNAISSRPIDSLVITSDQRRGDNVAKQTRYKGLAEEVESISRVSGIGWRIRADTSNKNYAFECAPGRDLTEEQDVLSKAIFSIERNNLKNRILTRSKLSYRNVALVAGAGEGVERKIVTVGNVNGTERRELFVDARDLQQEEGMTNAQYEELLRTRGLEKLEEAARVESFEAALSGSNLVYRQDYDLGDIVTVFDREWGVRFNQRITEITEIYETGDVQLEATFGITAPTLIERIKQEVRR